MPVWDDIARAAKAANDKACSWMDKETEALTDPYEKQYGKKLDAGVAYAIDSHKKALVASDVEQSELFSKAHTAFALVLIAACSGQGSTKRHTGRVVELLSYRVPDVDWQSRIEQIMGYSPVDRREVLEAVCDALV